LEQVFLAKAGEKIAIILNTSYRTHKPSKSYLEELQNRGVKIVELTASVEQLEGYRRGGIRINFIIDLNAPKITIVNQTGEILEQTTLTAVGKKPSTLPNVKALEERYFELVGISEFIARADVDKLRENKDLISQLPNIAEEAYGEYLLYAVEQTLKTQVPFSKNYLYKEDEIGRILKTLRLVEENNIGAVILAVLVNSAAEQIRNGARLKERPIHIKNHAEELVRFAIGYFNKQDEADQENFRNIAGIQIAFLLKELLEIKPDLDLRLPEKFTPPSNQITGDKPQNLLKGN